MKIIVLMGVVPKVPVRLRLLAREFGAMSDMAPVDAEHLDGLILAHGVPSPNAES